MEDSYKDENNEEKDDRKKREAFWEMIEDLEDVLHAWKEENDRMVAFEDDLGQAIFDKMLEVFPEFANLPDQVIIRYRDRMRFHTEMFVEELTNILAWVEEE